MTDQERFDALLNISVALDIAAAWLGPPGRLSRPVSRKELAEMLRKARRDADALRTEAALGVDVPRPAGTAITSETALLTLAVVGAADDRNSDRDSGGLSYEACEGEDYKGEIHDGEARNGD